MKIGIITFHNALNYGAMLQAYALQKYLLLQGHDVEIIDYRQSYITQTWALISHKRLKGNYMLYINTIYILRRKSGGLCRNFFCEAWNFRRLGTW